MDARTVDWRLPYRGESLAHYVRAAREDRSLSRDDVVRGTTLSSAAIRKIESGATLNPGLFTLRQVWKLLDLPTEALGSLPDPSTASPGSSG